MTQNGSGVSSESITLEETLRRLARANKVGAKTLLQMRHLWYGSGFGWQMTQWRGIPLLKSPTDLWMYQDLITTVVRPALIIETGSALGGSACYFGDLCQLNGFGRVVSIDLYPMMNPPAHPRVAWIKGSSTDPKLVRQIKKLAKAAAAEGPVMVTLDSDHSAAHVYRELEAYAPMVTPGSYCVVEDTHITDDCRSTWDGKPLLGKENVGKVKGPDLAVQRFLKAHKGKFSPDPLCERFLLTFHPGGWLRRLR